MYNIALGLVFILEFDIVTKLVIDISIKLFIDFPTSIYYFYQH